LLCYAEPETLLRAIVRQFFDRLRAYWRIGALLAYPALAICWVQTAIQFLRNMAPRFGHISAAGMQVADKPCLSPECDFSVFWPAGHLARAGDLGTLYNPALFLSFRQALFMPGVDQMAWIYPPPTLLVLMPVSLLPFESGFLVWSLCLSAFAAAFLRLAGLPWLVIAAALASPAALWNYELGQFGAVMGAALAGGLLLADRAGAGLMLALLLIKPQTALLAPVALLSGRHWRAFVACTVAVLVILALTTSRLGWIGWRDFMTDGLAVSRAFINRPLSESGAAPFGVSVFWMLRSFGAGLGAAYAGQAAAAAIAAALTWRLWRLAVAGPVERMAVTVFLALLTTPYGYTDDMVAWSVALAVLAWRRDWRIDLLDALFWLWPAIGPQIYLKTGLSFSPLLTLAAVLRFWPWLRGGDAKELHYG
jgi:hypothetical protein